MTPVEQLNQRAITFRQQLQAIGIFMTHPDAIDRVRRDDPSLAFQADQQSLRVVSEFANSNQGRAGKGTTTREEWKTFVAALQKNGMAYDDAVCFANSRPEFKHLSPRADFTNGGGSGSSDGRMSPGADLKTPNQVLSGARKFPEPSDANENGILLSDLEKFKLPYDCSADEYGWAQGSNLIPQAIFDRLVSGVMKKYNFNQSAAQTFCLGRFQKLARLCKVDPITQSSHEGTSRTS